MIGNGVEGIAWFRRRRRWLGLIGNGVEGIAWFGIKRGKRKKRILFLIRMRMDDCQKEKKRKIDFTTFPGLGLAHERKKPGLMLNARGKQK